MDRSFWTTVLKIAGGLLVTLFAIAAVSAHVFDVRNDGLTWPKVAQWIIGGIVTYGLYRFYRYGRDIQSDYHERWDRLFQREPSE